MFDFILSGYSEEPLLSHSARFIPFDIVVIPGWSCLWCLDFPRHHSRGVLIRSVMRPIGVILRSSRQIGYIWCHTGAYCLHLALEAIVLSHIRYSFHHSIEIYCIRLTDHYSWALHRYELSAERRSRLVESLSAIFQRIEICSGMPHWGIPPSLSTSAVLHIFLTTQSMYWSLRVIILGHPPTVIFVWGSPLLSSCLRGISSLFRAFPFISVYHHHGSSLMSHDRG